MDEKEIHPIKVLFFEGIIGTTFVSSLILIFSFIQCPDSLSPIMCAKGDSLLNLKTFINEIDWFAILFLVIWTVCCAGFNFFARLLIFYLTPTHRSIADTLSTFVFWIYLRIREIQDNNYSLFLTIFGYILTVFGFITKSLLFNYLTLIITQKKK